MNRVVSKLSVLSLIAIIAVNACKSDDPESSCQNGSFEMTFNGEQVTGVSFNNTLLKGNSGGVDAKRMDVRATDSKGRQLIISFTDQTTSSPANGVSTDEYVAFDDVTSSNQNAFFFTVVESGISYPIADGNLDITSCDASTLQVSGTFSFSSDEHTVTDGSFTNMCYTIIQ